MRETTPPLGLRHLRDDLERSRGTTEGHTRHARTPAWGAQRGSGGTSDPLNQFSTQGWKMTKAAVRLVEEYMMRVEHSTACMGMLAESN